MYVVSYVEEWLMFILQLSALYEVKPPISKAKMTSITRGAIKAIKFYKHVVQSVEKFIQKVKYVAVTCFCDIFLLHLSSLWHWNIMLRWECSGMWHQVFG